MCSLLKRRSALPVAELGDLVLRRWPDADRRLRCEAAAAAAVAHVLRGSAERGAALAHEAMAGSSELAAVNARRALFFRARMSGRDAEALRWAEEAIDVALRHDMAPWHNELLTFRAIALAATGRTGEAIEQVEVAHDAAPATGSPALVAWAASVRGCLLAAEDPRQARDACARAAQACNELDYPLGTGSAAGRSGRWPCETVTSPRPVTISAEPSTPTPASDTPPKSPSACGGSPGSPTPATGRVPRTSSSGPAARPAATWSRTSCGPRRPGTGRAGEPTRRLRCPKPSRWHARSERRPQPHARASRSPHGASRRPRPRLSPPEGEQARIDRREQEG